MQRKRATTLRALVIVAALATTALALIAPRAQANESGRTRIPACGSLDVVAHRGDHVHVENTVAAFRSAVKSGADAIETDVRTTRDHRLVLMHDRTLGRTTPERGRVHMLTAREIHAVRTNDGQRVPYVDAALRFVRNHKRIHGMLELKTMTRRSMIRLRGAIVRYGVMHRVAVSSKREKILRQAKRIMPHVRRKRLTWKPVRPHYTGRYANGVVIPLRTLARPRVKRYRAAGLQVTVMASTHRRSRRRMAQIGVDGLSTNNVPGFIEHCRTPRPVPKRVRQHREPENPFAGNRRPPRELGGSVTPQERVEREVGRLLRGLPVVPERQAT